MLVLQCNAANACLLVNAVTCECLLTLEFLRFNKNSVLKFWIFFWFLICYCVYANSFRLFKNIGFFLCAYIYMNKPIFCLIFFLCIVLIEICENFHCELN